MHMAFKKRVAPFFFSMSSVMFWGSMMGGKCRRSASALYSNWAESSERAAKLSKDQRGKGAPAALLIRLIGSLCIVAQFQLH